MKWIKCSDRLPPIGIEVLVLHKYESGALGYMVCDLYKFSGNILWNIQGYDTIEINDDYWCELPEKPE